MTSASRGHFGNVVICEDVRVEANNKHTLVGVLSGDLYLTIVPGDIDFAAYMEYFPGTAHTSLQLRMILDGVTIASTTAPMPRAPSGGPNVIIIPRGRIHVARDCEFKIEVATETEKWKVIVKKKLQKGTAVPLNVTIPTT